MNKRALGEQAGPRCTSGPWVNKEEAITPVAALLVTERTKRHQLVFLIYEVHLFTPEQLEELRLT